MYKCPWCKGTGKRKFIKIAHVETEDCLECDGTGLVGDNYQS